MMPEGKAIFQQMIELSTYRGMAGCAGEAFDRSFIVPNLCQRDSPLTFWLGWLLAATFPRPDAIRLYKAMRLTNKTGGWV